MEPTPPITTATTPPFQPHIIPHYLALYQISDTPSPSLIMLIQESHVDVQITANGKETSMRTPLIFTPLSWLTNSLTHSRRHIRLSPYDPWISKSVRPSLHFQTVAFAQPAIPVVFLVSASSARSTKVMNAPFTPTYTHNPASHPQ